jgi:hypothetical protein
MEQQIQLVQKPVIQHKLAEIGQSVTLRLEELNLTNLVATDDTIKSMKKLRADLNTEFDDYEKQRKALKEAVANPYQEFEVVYKLEITDKYKAAGDILKDKIGAFENKLKTDRAESLKLYFDELCANAKIDFLQWKHTGIEVQLSITDKKYKEQLTEFVNRVQDDILLINGMEYPAETMIEYKSNGLNASKAIQVIRDRKKAEKQERDRIKAIETSRRTKILHGLNFTFSDMTKSYHWIHDNEVFITLSDVENLSKEDFHKWISGVELLILEASSKANQAEQKPVEVKKAEPLEAPVEKTLLPPPPVTVKVVTASFTVTGTFAQLKALGQYMKENGIEYKNI